MLIDTDYLDTLPLYVLDELRLLTRNAYDRAKRANATPEEKEQAKTQRDKYKEKKRLYNAQYREKQREKQRVYNTQYQRARRAKLKSV